MATKKIALDAGHAEITAGKQTPDGIKEWTLNDKVRDKVVAFLSDYDVVFVFPDNNEGRTDEALKTRRTMYINEKVDAAVSIHHNAYTGKWNSATGVEVYTDKNATVRDKALAEAIYNRLVTNTGLRGRGIKEANWTVIDQDSIPAVLVEGGFMDSKKDYKVITSDTGQTAYARAIADALIEFLKLEKKQVSTPRPTQNTPSEVAKMTKTSGVSIPSKTARDKAASFIRALAGTYKVTASALNVRDGAGTGKEIMVTIPKGTRVECYGYFTTVSGVRWLYIQFTYKNVTYTGFASSNYLKK